MTNLVANDTSPLFKLEEFLPYRLTVLAHVVSTALTQLNAHHKLSTGEWLVLMSLGEVGPMTSKRLGTKNVMHKTKVSRIVAGLLERGLISRRLSFADRREAFLILTTLGENLYKECVPIAANFTKNLEAAILPADRDVLDRCLSGLAKKSERLMADPTLG